MNNPIDKLLTEWAYRVHDGMPNPKNQYHLVHLQESMEYLKVDGGVIDMVMIASFLISQKKMELIH